MRGGIAGKGYIMAGGENDEKQIKIEDIIHFFETEIELNKENNSRIEDRAIPISSPMFNGVNVGFENAKELRKAHIMYCQNIIDRIKNGTL